MATICSVSLAHEISFLQVLQGLNVFAEDDIDLAAEALHDVSSISLILVPTHLFNTLIDENYRK